MSPAIRGLRRRLVELARRPHGRTDLAEAALLIAAEAYPDLDIPACLRRVDALAALARRSMGPDLHAPPAQLALALKAFFFWQEEFRGNSADYYDARNSYFNDVLERRMGIPITLAILYLEVARRLGIAARGVAFPGHFLVKLLGPPVVVVDPFTGDALSREECQRRLEAALGPGHRLTDGHMAAAEPVDILARVLRNLKGIHAQAEDFLAALAASDRILLLMPDHSDELRERGLLLERLECFPEAAADLERTLELAPNQPQAEKLGEHLADLLARAGRLN